jgi:ferritin-like metal-binding protein YciE
MIMAIDNMQALFLHTLKDIYYAENQITKALPKMIDAATSDELKEAFETHLDQTNTQIERLEEVFKLLGEKASGEKCPAIEGIIKESEELMGEIKDESTRDAALIAAAQAVEHYEITRYGTLATWAEELQLDDIQALLLETLNEEHETDELLSDLAEARINPTAIETSASE